MIKGSVDGYAILYTNVKLYHGNVCYDLSKYCIPNGNEFEIEQCDKFVKVKMSLGTKSEDKNIETSRPNIDISRLEMEVDQEVETFDSKLVDQIKYIQEKTEIGTIGSTKKKPESPLQCSECNKTFVNNYLLDHHMRIIHKKTQEKIAAVHEEKKMINIISSRDVEVDQEVQTFDSNLDGETNITDLSKNFDLPEGSSNIISTIKKETCSLDELDTTSLVDQIKVIQEKTENEILGSTKRKLQSPLECSECNKVCINSYLLDHHIRVIHKKTQEEIAAVHEGKKIINCLKEVGMFYEKTISSCEMEVDQEVETFDSKLDGETNITDLSKKIDLSEGSFDRISNDECYTAINKETGSLDKSNATLFVDQSRETSNYAEIKTKINIQNGLSNLLNDSTNENSSHEMTDQEIITIDVATVDRNLIKIIKNDDEIRDVIDIKGIDEDMNLKMECCDIQKKTEGKIESLRLTKKARSLKCSECKKYF